jgi:hypothetical protein
VYRVNEADGLRAVYDLRECAMEESVFNVELVHGPTPGGNQSLHSPDGGRLDDRAEGLIVVYPGALSEPPDDSMSLVPFKRAIHLELVLEDPLTGNDIGPKRPKNQVPRPVRQQGLVLLLHSVMPVGVHERAMDKGQDGRQYRGSNDDREL